MTENKRGSDLEEAVRKGDVEAVKNRLGIGSSPEVQGRSKETPLHSAMTEIEEEELCHATVELLLKHSADVDAVDGNGSTTLMLASEKGQYATVKTLLESGANPNIQDNDLQSVLHRTIGSNTEEQVSNDIIQLLIAFGADCNLLNYRGSTPLHMASELKKVLPLKTLLEYKANPNILNIFQFAPLHYAIHCVTNKETLNTIVGLLLDYGADINLPSLLRLFF